MDYKQLKQIVNDTWRFMLVNDLTDNNPYYIGIKKNFETACWSFNLKNNKHSIYVGDKIFDSVKKIGKLGIEYYVASYLHHEVSHSLHTKKDIKDLNNWLNSNKVPFSLWNIFEDARIESKWRVDTNRLFKWTDYEDSPKINKDSNANEMMFVYVQKEGNWRSRLPKMKRVREYYLRIVECDSTEDLYPILLEWIKEFPETSEDLEKLKEQGFMGNSSSSPMGSSDLETSVAMQENPKLAEDMDKDCEDVVGKSNYTDEDNEVELYEELNPIEEYTTNSSRIFDEHGSYSFDKKLADSLMPVLEKIFKGKNRKVASVTPSKRLNTRGIAAGRWDKLYRKELEVTKMKKNVNIILDCSGSMSGTPIKNARALTYMLNKLALKGFLEGHIILTGAKGSSSQTYTIPLPVKEEFISSIIADGDAEGIKGTFDLTKKLMRKADWNFVFTDGNISDSAIDTDKMVAEGIHTFGLYVGDSSSCNLSKWFNKYLTRDTLKGLMEKLIQKIK